jgi:hypothetical protein
MKHYLDKNVPGLIKVDLMLPPLLRGKEYLWEKTAGAGIVPKWVSLVGLLAIPFLLVAVIIILISFLI